MSCFLDLRIIFSRLITGRERERIGINMDLYFSMTETLDADFRNLPEAPVVLVHLMLCTRAMPICASVLQQLVITTTTLTKVGQLRCEGGCTGRDVAARGGEAESDDSPRESKASPIKLLPCYTRISSPGTFFFRLTSHEKST